MQLSKYTYTVLLSLCWSLCALPAEATPNHSDTLIVDGPTASYTLLVHHKRPVVIRADEAILSHSKPEDWKIKVFVNRAAGAVTLIAPEGATEEEVTGQLTLVLRKSTIYVTVLRADKLDEAKSPIAIQHRGILQALDAAAKQRAQAEITAKDKEMQQAMEDKDEEHAEAMEEQEAEHRRELAKVRRRSGEFELLREHGGETQTITFDSPDTCGRSGSFAICPVRWRKLGQRAIVSFDAYNGTSGTVELNEFKAFGEGNTNNRAGAVRVGEGEPMEQGEAHAILNSMERVTISMVVRDVSTVGKQVSLLVAGPGVRPTMEYIDLRPKPGEGLITLSVQGIAGAVWLANPVDTTQLGATSTAGLEMRVRYGFSRRWSFEAALAGARSGSASWDGMMYENQEGEIARNATLGRLLLGGVLHFGKKYRPMIRAGLGVQGVSHESRFIPAAGQDREGPGEGFTADGLFYLGVGMEAELGHHWTAGLSTNFVRSLDPAIRSAVEGGLQLNYRWTPGL